MTITPSLADAARTVREFLADIASNDDHFGATRDQAAALVDLLDTAHTEASCVATDPNFLTTDPEFCRRCGQACAHTEPCVLVVDTSDGPVCIDAQACSVRREGKGLTADGSLDVCGASLVASWSQLWCPACGNRYDADRVQATHCSCLVPLQPVTLQLVTRRP